ncbi:MAG: hypothetical protein H6825_05280 [Planctomycetes bacterium]|nr:hypothetical protein [Planctomycetota bacterium]
MSALAPPVVRPLAACAALVLWLATSASAQHGGRDCQTTGKLPYDVSSKYLVDYTPFVDEGKPRTWEVLFWSKAIESDNMGIDWIPCKRCVDKDLLASAEAELTALMDARTAWLAERRQVDAVVKVDDPLAHVETTHFVVAWNIPKITVDKKSIRAEDAALLYAMRMEQTYARFQDLTGTTDADYMKTKHYFYFFEKEREALLAGSRYAGLTGSGTVRRAGGDSHDSVVVGWFDKSKTPSDEDFQRHWIYNLTHQMTAAYYNVFWFKPGEKGLSPPWLNDKYGWLGAGLAHWMEWDFDEKATNFSFREQDLNARWKGPDWRKNVWKAVKAEDFPSFAEAITKPIEALSVQEHQFCYSWIDFLMHKDSHAMASAMKLAKMERPARDILKEAWGISMLTFEGEWAAWVLEEYAPTNKTGGTLLGRPIGTGLPPGGIPTDDGR